MALAPTLSDPESMEVILEAEAGILQGMAQYLCNEFIPNLKAIVETSASPTQEEVEEQVAKLKTILCGYTAKECAMADLIKAIAKKTAVDEGIDPTEVCKCLGCNK